MIIGTAAVLAVVIVIVATACYRATGIYIKVDNINSKSDDKTH